MLPVPGTGTVVPWYQQISNERKNCNDFHVKWNYNNILTIKMFTINQNICWYWYGTYLVPTYWNGRHLSPQKYECGPKTKKNTTNIVMKYRMKDCKYRYPQIRKHRRNYSFRFAKKVGMSLIEGIKKLKNWIGHLNKNQIGRRFMFFKFLFYKMKYRICNL